MKVRSEVTPPEQSQPTPEMTPWPEIGTVSTGGLTYPLEKALLQAYAFKLKPNRSDVTYQGPEVGADIIAGMSAEALNMKLHPGKLEIVEEMWGDIARLHELLESAILIGMEQGRRIEPLRNRVLKADLTKLTARLIKGEDVVDKITNASVPEVKGWKSDEHLSFHDLVTPIVESIKKTYTLERINVGTDIPYDGYNIGQKALSVSHDVQTQLTAESLKYNEEEQDRDPLYTFVGIAVQLGIENGMRHWDQTTIDKTTFCLNLMHATL